MTITALPTPPTRSDPANFADRADAFLAALPTFAEEANALAVAMNLNSTTDTSASSVLIGTGEKTFAVTAGKSFQPGMYLVIADAAAPSTNSMWGQITIYLGTSLVVNIIAVRGSGTKTSWVISQSAPGSAAAGANTDITSIAGNAATATAANGGYFTAASDYPRLEIHKPGVMAGQWAINSSNNYVFEATDGGGLGYQTLLTITPAGVLSIPGGFGGNAATATRLSGDTGAAPSYSCRAWVNFNGTGTVAIRASGNVSSITDNGVGDYTVNFITAMPDTNYCFEGSCGGTGTNGILVTFGSDADPVSVLTGSIDVQTKTPSSYVKLDTSHVSVAIFR